jgi:bifunctional DNA-binding transcriptional regulator/antitoxin component of YhaV-PrlF toxin-antitoxin module
MAATRDPDPSRGGAGGTPRSRGTNHGGAAGSPLPSRTSWPVRLDSRRRPTLPEELLSEARVARGEELVAHVESEGRIVLETRDAIRRRLRQRFAEGRARVGHSGNPVADLLQERSRDTSLDGVHAGSDPSPQ